MLLAELKSSDAGNVVLRVQCSVGDAVGGAVRPLTKLRLRLGQEYILQPRHADFNTARLVGRLHARDGGVTERRVSG